MKYTSEGEKSLYFVLYNFVSQQNIDNLFKCSFIIFRQIFKIFCTVSLFAEKVFFTLNMYLNTTLRSNLLSMIKSKMLERFN